MFNLKNVHEESVWCLCLHRRKSPKNLVLERQEKFSYFPYECPSFITDFDCKSLIINVRMLIFRVLFEEYKENMLIF